MPKIVDKRTFASPEGAWKGGMNKDVDLRYLQNGFYRDGRNISIFNHGDRLVVSNVKGNKAVFTGSLPVDTYYVCGAYDNRSTKTLYYLLHRPSNTTDYVLEYKYDLGEGGDNYAYSVILEGALGFGISTTITGITIVNERFFVWADGTTEIVCIDLENLPGVTITTSNRWRIELAKAPDPLPMECGTSMTVGSSGNLLSGSMYKFRLRYVYQGGFRTHFSTYAKVPNSVGPVIYLKVPLPDYDTVEKIEIFVQSGGTDDTMGNWYKFKELLYTEFGTGDELLVIYDGTQPKTIADQTEANEAFSFIPPTCKDIIFLPSNVLAFANITEGFDADVETKVSVYPVINTRETASAATTTLTYDSTVVPTTGSYRNVNFGILLDTSLNYHTLTVGGTVKAGDVLNVSVTVAYAGTAPTALPNKTIQVIYPVTEGDTAATVAQKLANGINSFDTAQQGFGGIFAYWPGAGAVVRLIYGQNRLNDPYTITSSINAVDIAAVVNSIGNLESSPKPSFKMWGRHPFAIQYEDIKGRRSGAIPCGGFQSISSWYSISTWISAQMVINHTAPDDAVRYHILYSPKSSFSKFVSVWCTATDTSGVWSFNVISVLNNDAKDSGTIADEYNFVKGDRLRYLAYNNAGSITPLDSSDTEITGTVSGTSVTVVGTPPTIATGDLVLVELFRPTTKNAEVIYYEIGHTYEVVNGLHHGNNQNQTGSQGAIVDLNDCGDCWSRRHTTSSGVSSKYWTGEYESITEKYVSAITARGRLNFNEPSASNKIYRTTAISFTQPIIANSPTNGLAMALGSSIQDYDLKFGSIQKVSLRGQKQLTVYFEEKVGEIGVFEELQKANSGDVIYQTSALLNGINYHTYDGGIGTNPEGHSVHDNTEYFPCIRNNAICRLSQAGIHEISKYGLEGYFNELFDVKTNYMSDVKVFGAFENRTRSYVIGVKSITPVKKAIGTVVTYIYMPHASGKMRVGAKFLGDDINGDTTLLVVETFSEPITDTYEVEFVGGTAPNDWDNIRFINSTEAIFFNEELNSWTSFQDFTPDILCTAGNDLASFGENRMYIHNQNETRGSFYGTEYPATITIPFNKAAEIMKRFFNIELDSNQVWTSETDGDVSTIEGQTSQLFSNYYEEFQPEEWSAAFRQDTSTPNRTNPLLDGYDLRGKVLLVKLTNDSTDKVTLSSVTVLSQTTGTSK